MPTQAQKDAARENIEKAQEKWQEMSHEERARAQPEGREREAPGAGEGDYYRVVVRDKDQFQTFRTHDVGDPGHVQRLAGKRESGSWDTQAWLILKEDAHVENGRLVADTEDVQKVLDELESTPRHTSGDRFEAEPRRNVPEKDKPTKAQQKARQKNIRKAQQAAQKKRKAND